jgi:hypothetical protein
MADLRRLVRDVAWKEAYDLASEMLASPLRHSVPKETWACVADELAHIQAEGSRRPATSQMTILVSRSLDAGQQSVALRLSPSPRIPERVVSVYPVEGLFETLLPLVQLPFWDYSPCAYAPVAQRQGVALTIGSAPRPKLTALPDEPLRVCVPGLRKAALCGEWESVRRMKKLATELLSLESQSAWPSPSQQSGIGSIQAVRAKETVPPEERYCEPNVTPPPPRGVSHLGWRRSASSELAGWVILLKEEINVIYTLLDLLSLKSRLAKSLNRSRNAPTRRLVTTLTLPPQR